MRIVQSGLISFFLVFASAFPAAAQDSPSSPASSTPKVSSPARSADPAPQAAPAASFNDVLDRVVQREHLFLAQMRHMRPMVETYLQNIKNDSNGNPSPVKDQYFLGRLDMTDGPE